MIPATALAPAPPTESGLQALLGLCRLHIVAIASLAALVFGWIFDGAFHPLPALLVGLDWFILNLWNRLADVAEDLRNGVPGAGFAARHPWSVGLGCAAAFGLSLALCRGLGGALVALRILFQLGGFAYSFRILPGRTRLKDLFFVKNLSSGLLFLVTDLGYPLALRLGGAPRVPWLEVAALAAFFLPFELSYELIYDLRDVEGDRAEGIRTVPVARGERSTRRLIAALLALSAVPLGLGYAAGILPFACVAMIAAPIQQALLLRFPLRTKVSAAWAVRATYLGAAQLASFVAWVSLGLPVGAPF